MEIDDSPAGTAVVLAEDEDDNNKSYDKIAVSLMNKYKESEFYAM